MPLAIGNTPLCRLSTLTGPDDAEVWVKWEGANPTGSMKDRPAKAMVEGALQRGDLKPGGTVVDYTGGSTGSSLAMVCAGLGLHSHFVTNDAIALAKRNTMKAFGATVDVFESGDGKITKELIERCFVRVHELRAKPGYFYTDQFNNPDNRAAYHVLGKELLDALDGRIDAFVAGVGTGGCVSGVAEYLKPRVRSCTFHPVEPLNSQPLAGKVPTGGHLLERMGAGFVPGNYQAHLMDEIFAVSDDDALQTARLLAQKEGIFGGSSSGANVFVALQLAKRLGPGKRVVTVICDSGLKYLDGPLYQANA
jgi:cysteine synthase A